MRESERRGGAIVAGKYRLVRRIGSGAMGAVYEAEHLEIGKRVALKVIHPTFLGNHEACARFRREARAAARIDSDYIVQCFDVGEDPAHGLYMVIEYLVGEDLEQRLHRTRRLDAGTVVALGYQVARGLARAHEAGVIHRDLKPANVFLTTRRDDDTLLAKVLDFGISKLKEAELGEGRLDGLTAPGVTLGTPQYMSPEQIDGRIALDGRTDVWALAALLYECLRGQPAFAGRDYLETLLDIMHGTPPHLRDVAPWVPRPLADLVHQGLVRDRDHRVPDAATFADRLLRVLPHPTVSGRYTVAPARGTSADPDETWEPPASSRGSARVPLFPPEAETQAGDPAKRTRTRG